jgi:TRAP transporter 4TM/12TM fusion protein
MKSRLNSFWNTIVIIFTLLGIALTINQVFYMNLFGFKPVTNAFLYYILACFLPLVFLFFPMRKSQSGPVPWYDVILAVIALIIPFYFAIKGEQIIVSGWEYNAPPLPTFFSILLWILTLEALRRTAGIVIMIIALIFSIYPMIADKVPIYFLQGQSFDFLTTARNHALSSNSIIGIPFQTVGSLLIGFLVFGVVLQYTGGGNFFFNLAQSLFGRARGGPAKVAVVSSALMGMMSGSAVSNVLTTGSMTIPAMKKAGYHPEYAAGIEATAATGGSITPPIMGSAAFIMASLLGIPYAEIALAAAIPAFLYYLGIFVQVDGYAAKVGLHGASKEDIPGFFPTLKSGWYYLISLVVLVYLLVTLRAEAQAPFYAILFLILVAVLKKTDRMNWSGFREMIIQSGKTLSEIVGIIAGVGLIVGGLSVTGVSLSFSRELVVAVGDNVFLILVAGALTSFILGMGMTVSAVYVFLAIVMAPALVELGINPIAAHLFVIYWATISYITPPVALASFAAAGIAGTSPMRTGLMAMKLGMVKYVVPFLFVINPSLVAQGPWLDVLYNLVTAIIGVILMASAMEGWLVGVGRLKYWFARIPLFLSGILLMIPGGLTDLIGVLLLVAVVSFSLLMRKRQSGSDVNDFLRQ